MKVAPSHTGFYKIPRIISAVIGRNPASPTAQKLAAQGTEIAGADLDDVTSLTSAFLGANLIFSVTNYWEPFFPI
jgi:NmrA-like family